MLIAELKKHLRAGHMFLSLQATRQVEAKKRVAEDAQGICRATVVCDGLAQVCVCLHPLHRHSSQPPVLTMPMQVLTQKKPRSRQKPPSRSSPTPNWCSTQAPRTQSESQPQAQPTAPPVHAWTPEFSQAHEHADTGCPSPRHLEGTSQHDGTANKHLPAEFTPVTCFLEALLDQMEDGDLPKTGTLELGSGVVSPPGRRHSFRTSRGRQRGSCGKLAHLPPHC